MMRAQRRAAYEAAGRHDQIGAGGKGTTDGRAQPSSLRPRLQCRIGCSHWHPSMDNDDSAAYGDGEASAALNAAKRHISFES